MLRPGSLVLHAPCDGIFLPLNKVPDEAFSSGQLGLGLAFEPLEEVLNAPCEGQVSMCAKTQHAVSLRLGSKSTENSPELLIHLGLDSVELNGEGMVLQVKEGEHVGEGTPLLKFDAERVGSQVKSLITPLVVVSGEDIKFDIEDYGYKRAGERIATLHFSQDEQRYDITDGQELHRRVKVLLGSGLHARPSAALKKIAEEHGTQLHVNYNGQRASVKSVTALIGLGIEKGSEITLSASGPKASTTLDEAERLLVTPEEHASSPSWTVCHPDVPQQTIAPQKKSDLEAEGIYSGLSASPGLAIAPLVLWLPDEAEIIETKGQGVAYETERLEKTLESLRTQLKKQSATESRQEDKTILEAHADWLEDPTLIEPALAFINEGLSAASAWQKSLHKQSEQLLRSDNALVRSRADDLRDLSRRVVTSLEGGSQKHDLITAGSIIVTDDLTPSQLMQLDAVKPAGICLSKGGITSHVTILARARGLPMLVGIGQSLLDQLKANDLSTAILDTDSGILSTRPTEAQIVAAGEQREQQQRIDREARTQASNSAVTLDGKQVEVAANIGRGEDAMEAFQQGAEGIGLFRSEFLFLGHEAPPSIQEQQASYQVALDAAQGKPVIIRTLDIGADKQLPYLDLGPSVNPALGIRGARMIDRYPDLLAQQLRALLACHAQGKNSLKIMLPMVTDIGDVQRFKTLMVEQEEAMGLIHQPGYSSPQLGIMVEVPAAALCAAQLAREVDFFSIGTNDLTQYCLAMDREETALAPRMDALHPSVLTLVRHCVQGAAQYQRWVGVCGAAAGDELAAIAFTALGVNELSMESSRIANIKSRIRQLNQGDLAAHMDHLLSLDSAQAVRAWLRHYLTQGNGGTAPSSENNTNNKTTTH